MKYVKRFKDLNWYNENVNPNNGNVEIGPTFTKEMSTLLCGKVLISKCYYIERVSVSNKLFLLDARFFENIYFMIYKKGKYFTLESSIGKFIPMLFRSEQECVDFLEKNPNLFKRNE